MSKKVQSSNCTFNHRRFSCVQLKGPLVVSAQIIGCFGVGVDAIDLEKAKELGVPVTNTPGVLTEDTADTALTLLLATLRKACAADR